jgi:nitroreductase
MATVASDVGSSPAQLMVDQVLTTTRNVRKRLDLSREVPRQVIEDCARVAMQAPIACNGFYPHFVVVTDPAKRAALAPIYKRSWDLHLPMPISVPNLHFDDPRHEAQQPRVAASATYLAEHIAEVPALVIPCISPRVDGMPMWIQACLWGSVLPHAWSFMLAARARGLAAQAGLDPHPVRGRGGQHPGHQPRRGAASGHDRPGLSARRGLQGGVPRAHPEVHARLFARQLLLRPFGQGEVIRGVAMGRVVDRSSRDEALARVLAERFQQPVADPTLSRRVRHDQRFVHQLPQNLQELARLQAVVTAHRLGRVQRPAPDEHREPIEQPPLSIREEVVAPLYGRLQRLLAW